jgi:hypothetical protein
VVKTAINLAAKTQFCMIYILQNAVKIDLVLNKKITNPLIQKTKNHPNNLFFYVFKITNINQVNENLIGWLVDAYNLRN